MNIFKREIFANIVIFFMGFLLIAIPVTFLKEITSPMSVVFLSVGCSLIATGIAAFLSFIYRLKENDISEISNAIGLIDILKGNSAIMQISKSIKNAKSTIYISRLSPFFINDFPKTIDEKAKHGVNIRLLYNENHGFFNIANSYHVINNVFGETVEVRQYRDELDGMVICDNIAYVYQISSFVGNGNDIKTTPVVFVYRQTSMNSLYDVYMDDFNRKWSMAKETQTNIF